MNSTTSWSQTLQAYTLASLQFRNDFIPLRDDIYFKHIQGGQAIMSLDDFANQRPRLTDFKGKVYQFDSIESLVNDGWALD